MRCKNFRLLAFVTFRNNRTEIAIVDDTRVVNNLSFEVHPVLQNDGNLNARSLEFIRTVKGE